MKICKVDNRGRLALKKLVEDLPAHYKFEQCQDGIILLTPIEDGQESD